MTTVKDKKVIRIKDDEEQRAKREAARVLREFINKPDDLVTMREATRALKIVARMLLGEEEE